MKAGREWRTLGSRRLYENPWCAFRVDDVELPDGTGIEYGVLETGGFAAVVPVTDAGNVVLVRQWRQPAGSFALELPGGGVDRGEDPKEAAGRELFEETGYRAEGLEHLTTVHTTPGRADEVCHLFRCRAVLDPAGPEPEPTEFISTVEVPLAEALGAVRKAGPVAAATALGLLLVSSGTLA